MSQIQWPKEAQEDEFNKEDREKAHLGPQASEMTHIFSFPPNTFGDIT